ncbi:MAG: Nudix family hydrolase [Pseudomonadales bacterium]|nr:Nudix family hydrolase [Pseudomonadales bacterium]
MAVGVIRNEEGAVLIAQRARDSHQGGLWEFPGGKIEADENVTEALARELAEELGIQVQAQSPLCQIAHDYGDRSVLLDVWSVDRFAGTPQGLEKQPLRWLPVDQLQAAEFPQANRAIIRRLKLPEMIAISGDAEDEQNFHDRFEQVLALGLKLVYLRVKELSEEGLRQRAQRCAQLCQIYNAAFVLNADPELAIECGASGFHANSQLLLASNERPVPDTMLFGASCHDEQQVRHAMAIGADYLFLSPVLATDSHPGRKPLGWEQFGRLCGISTVPVYALGGMKEEHLALCKRHGALGLAAIGAFW